jgi:hypothetical protein
MSDFFDAERDPEITFRSTEIATRSAGMWRWTSICCSSETTQMLTGDVLFVSGSLRRGSYHTALLREAANALPSGGGLPSTSTEPAAARAWECEGAAEPQRLVSGGYR